jgi:hypothetical protein
MADSGASFPIVFKGDDLTPIIQTHTNRNLVPRVFKSYSYWRGSTYLKLSNFGYFN